MGSRGHLLLALSAAALLASCVDFASPRFPNAGAPAFLQLSASVLEGGVISLNAQLMPGRDSIGVTRVPLDSTIFVNGQAVEPDTILPRNTLMFSENVTVGNAALAGPISVLAPPVSGIQASPPFFIWYGMVKGDSGVVYVNAGQDLVLHVRARLGEAVPPVQTRQWYLDLYGPEGAFRVSGNGYPPDTMRIPPQWVPASTPGATVIASLLYYQSSLVRPPPGDYTGNLSLDVRLQWTVQLR